MTSVNFTLRRGGVSPVFVGTYRIGGGDMIGPWEPGPNDIATLRLDDVEVIVRIRTAKDRKYTGVVVGFENFDGPQFGGVEVDAEVHFAFEHMLSCMR